MDAFHLEHHAYCTDYHVYDRAGGSEEGLFYGGKRVDAALDDMQVWILRGERGKFGGGPGEDVDGVPCTKAVLEDREAGASCCTEDGDGGL